MVSLTVGSIVRDNTAHAHLRGTLQKTLGHDRISVSERSQLTSNCEDTVMDTWCEAFRFLSTLGERARRHAG